VKKNPLAMGNLAFRYKRYKMAVRYYDLCIKRKYSPEAAWTNKGCVFASQGRVYEGLVCFDEALKLNPRNKKALFNKASALAQLGRYEEALQCIEDILSMNPKISKAWYEKGVIMGRLGQRDIAKKCYSNVLSLERKGELEFTSLESFTPTKESLNVVEDLTDFSFLSGDVDEDFSAVFSDGGEDVPKLEGGFDDPGMGDGLGMDFSDLGDGGDLDGLGDMGGMPDLMGDDMDLDGIGDMDLGDMGEFDLDGMAFEDIADGDSLFSDLGEIDEGDFMDLSSIEESDDVEGLFDLLEDEDDSRKKKRK